MIDGVDYSRTPHSNWEGLAAALRAQGKTFAWRYAVNDLSPGGRGISATEHRALRAAGLDVGIYWESSEGWMLGGFAAGQQAARNAEYNLAQAGMPATTPIYFACDFDAAPSDQAAIDDCLRGAAAVIGFERTGLYAGYWPLMRAKVNGTARWFCQTSAWSGNGQGGIFIVAGLHLLQYAYNALFDGVNCDLVRAYQPNFGQANPPAAPAPVPAPVPTPQPTDQPPGPTYPTPMLPDWWRAEKKLKFPTNRHVGASLWVASRGKSTVARDTEQRIVASVKGRQAGPTLKRGNIIHRERILTAADGKEWVILSAGGKGREGARVLRADLTDAPEFPAPSESKKG